MGKGQNTTTTSSTSSADPQAAAAYRDILTRAQGVASTPYQAYQGDLTAPINSQQQAGIAGINANAGYASPFLAQAQGLAAGAANPLTASQIQSYLNPYTQNVVDATNAQMQHDNGVQMASLQGNQIAQGALGGNATGVAKGILAGQNARTMASTDANLYSQGYQGALNTAYQQYQQNPLAAGNAIANYGLQGQNAALTGATAQIGAGSLEQQTQQQQMNALYGQYAQAQAFPYQQTQWLAGLGTGVGSNLGTSSTGQTTGPAPNQTAQYAGLGLAAAGLFLNRGGAVHRYANGGGVFPQHMADGGVSGTPWAMGQGWIPQLNIHGGAAPHAGSASSLPQAPAFDASKFASGIAGIGSKSGGLSGQIGQFFNPDAYGNGNAVYGGSSSNPLAGLTADDYGEGYASGGGVAGYAGGGVPVYDDPNVPVSMFGEGEPMLPPGASFEDRAAPHREAITRGDYDPAGINSTTFEGSPGMVASNTGTVPVPRTRPEEAPVVASDDDDDETPTGVAGRSTGSPSGGVGAFTPRTPGSYYSAPDAVAQPREREGGFGLGVLSPNAKTGLLTAGLGMLASRSPFLGNAIGEGGLAGLSAYGTAEEHDRKVAAEAAKLSAEARDKQAKFGLDVEKQNETSRHNRASEEAGTKLPALYTRDKNGNIILAPGAEEATRKLTEARHPQSGEPLGDEAVQMLADRVRAGDTKALVGLGRGIQGSVDLRRIQSRVAADAAAGKPVNEAARSILENAAQQAGLVTAERTQAAIMAKLSVYGRTAFNATDIALEASKAVPRTQFMPVNKIINAAREKTGDPKIVALGQALMTLSNEYARAIGGGHGTVHDKEAAERRLSAAQTPEQLEAVINIMRREVIAEERAMPSARQQIRDIYNPGAAGARGNSIAGEHGMASPPGPVTGASGVPTFTPPPGAIPRVYQGKTYYYDPATKQPYPGQG